MHFTDGEKDAQREHGPVSCLIGDGLMVRRGLLTPTNSPN